jgi:dipeptidyl aminopeptidase/acylaminoacyl peptidase
MIVRQCASVCLFLLSPLVLLSPLAFSQISYQKPPAPIEQLLDAPVTPLLSLSPDRKTMLVEQPQDFPSIAEIAQPRYRLAGLRFNPATNGPSREYSMVKLALIPVVGGAEQTIKGLPEHLRASSIQWSPDSKHIAFVQRSFAADGPGRSAGLELWVVDVSAASGHRLGKLRLNAVLGSPIEWMPNSEALICRIVPEGRGEAPKAGTVPAGPDVEENLGKVSPAPTYEDLLKTADDEKIFEFYATSQVAVVPLSGAAKSLAVKGLILNATPSPDGRFLLVEELHRPFSYTFPAEMFPLKSEIFTLQTGAVKALFDRPLVDYLPIANDADPAGPREYDWESDAPATLTWLEAGDGGDPNVKTEIHDRLFTLSAPFEGKGAVVLESPMRIRAIYWGRPNVAVASEQRWSDRHTAMVAFNPAASAAAAKPVTLYEGSSQDRYHSPGKPTLETNTYGKQVMRFTPDGGGIYFASPGASPAGDMPFVATMPVAGGEEKILWRSGADLYASPAALLSDDAILVREESKTVSPNYFKASLTDAHASPLPLTHFPSPYAGIRMPTSQLLHYKRADGLELTATLWLPAGYDKSQGPLPTLMEAYPAEFKTRSAAGQVAGSPNRFPRIGWGSPIFFTLTGYAVLENASIPIIGEGTAQPNDTYVEQLVAGAKAAIDYGASIGVVDAKRVAVMGHSYGAFMTANLLAHSDLFRAGIARSGAYNRTLTPYGFQAEERTYWQAPQVYYNMSPFSFADKIKTPILLIHGEADDNTGTYPIQSERFYAALKGQGATVRLVFLPLEAHGYEARESIEHMLWEMNRWLDTYVKPTAVKAQVQ